MRLLYGFRFRDEICCAKLNPGMRVFITRVFFYQMILQITTIHDLLLCKFVIT